MKIETYRTCKIIIAFCFFILFGYFVFSMSEVGRFQFHNQAGRILDTKTGDVYNFQKQKITKKQ